MLRAAVIAALSIASGAQAAVHGIAPPAPGPDARPAIKGLTSFPGVPGSCPATNAVGGPNAYPGVYSGVVIEGCWSSLQPNGAGTDLVTAEIDTGLANVRTYNAAHPTTPLKVSLRVFMGTRAPAWAMALDGGPLTVVGSGGSNITIGVWWGPNYRAAAIDLQAKLAAKYNDDPLIAEVSVSSTATSTAEPLVQPLGSTDIPIVSAAGLTDTVQQQIYLNQFTDYSAVWTKPAIHYSMNDFRAINGGVGNVFNQPSNNAAIMAFFRAKLGPRAVLANHALDVVAPNNPGQEFFPSILTMGPPITFQTVSPAKGNGQWDTIFANCQAFGCTEMELWDNADATLTQRQTYAAALGGH